MPSINGTLEMARRALLTQQAAIGITGENIANINTPGYARRRAEVTPSPSLTTPEGTYGSGVMIESISSIRDPFVETQIRRAMGDVGRYSESNRQLQMIEGMVNGLDETGLNASLDRFWNSWHDLASDPTSRGARSAVREAGVGLSNRFQALHAGLANHENDVNNLIVDRIERVNVLTAQLARMNGEMINKGKSGEIDDGRATLLDELANLAGADNRLADDGTVTLLVNGVSIVDGRQARELLYERDSNGKPVILPLTAGGAVPKIATGEIAGLYSVVENDLAALRESLDQIAVTVAREVNAIHSSGVDANGNTALAFFDEDITGMGDFVVSELILQDSGRIAAELEPGSGDNLIALRIAELQNTPLVNGESIGEAFQAIVTDLGAGIREVELMSEVADSSLTQMESYRESASGVSIDEEMANLLRYENAYNAAAKLTQVLSKMLDTILTI